jgi:outer membrane immunogenic protein
MAGIASIGASASARAESPPLFKGFYIGLNAGAAWGQSSFSTLPDCPLSALVTFCDGSSSSYANGTAVSASGTGDMSSVGFAGGVQAGYNWQRGLHVYGVEVDFGAFDLEQRSSESGLFPVTFLGDQYSLTQKMSADWLATLRARIGYTLRPDILLYATGGLAFSQVKFSSSYSDNAVGFGFPGGSGYAARSEMKTGWAAGGGAEWSHDRNWTIRVEYLYVDLGTINLVVPTSNTPEYTQTMGVSSDLTAQIGRLGISYRY